jgi:hypothetical protein
MQPAASPMDSVPWQVRLAPTGKLMSCLVSGTPGLLRTHSAADRPSAIIRAEAGSELACDAFRSGCCCTLLLYQALEPWAQDFELCF